MKEQCSIIAYKGCDLQNIKIMMNVYCIVQKNEVLKDYHKSFDMLAKFYDNLITRTIKLLIK